MKRFILFVGMHYYPGKAFQDYVCDCDTWEACILTKNETIDPTWPEGYWWQVFDTVTMTAINEMHPHNWIAVKDL